MSTLWTPEGEHRVPREDSPEQDGNSAPSSPGAPVSEEVDPDDDARLGDISELERRLVAAPVEDVVANHCYGLFQLAALHLGQNPPQLDEARLAIDALAAVVEGLGNRLGAAAPTLADGLAQIRLAFVQIAGASEATAADVSPPAEDSAQAET